jgi:hypothetical protein
LSQILLRWRLARWRDPVVDRTRLTGPTGHPWDLQLVVGPEERMSPHYSAVRAMVSDFHR